MTCDCDRGLDGICYRHDEPPEPLFEYVDDSMNRFNVLWAIATTICFGLLSVMWVVALVLWVAL